MSKAFEKCVYLISAGKQPSMILEITLVIIGKLDTVVTLHKSMLLSTDISIDMVI